MAGSSTDEYVPSDLSIPESRNEPIHSQLADAESKEGDKSDTAVKSQKRKYPGSRKRKLDPESSDATSKWNKRAKTTYKPKYLWLYNETVKEIASGLSSTFWRDQGSENLGLIPWTLDEKDRFFAALDRKGKDNLQAIANAIGTKSESEVSNYIQLLERGVRSEHLDRDRYRALEYADHAITLELSSECTQTLESAADALSERQLRHEKTTEESRHGEFWLLDEDIARRLDDLYEEEGLIRLQGKAGSNLLVAANLLNPTNFVELSTRLFMNSTTREDNWRYHRYGDTPSIFCTAFLDFHCLIVGITKRIVSTAVFLASSRIRAKEAKRGTTPKRDLKVQDVKAALDVLGFKHDKHKYWEGIARRCNLDVYEDHKAAVTKRVSPMSYEDVERQLREFRGRDISRQPPLLISEDDEEQRRGLQSSPPPLRMPEKIHKAKDLEESELVGDEYAEAQDMEASRKEELRLLELLKEEIQGETLDPLERKVPKPRFSRKDKEDLTDWRDLLDYRPEWETYRKLIPEEAFEINRKKRHLSKAIDSSSESDDETSNNSEDLVRRRSQRIHRLSSGDRDTSGGNGSSDTIPPASSQEVEDLRKAQRSDRGQERSSAYGDEIESASESKVKRSKKTIDAKDATFALEQEDSESDEGIDTNEGEPASERRDNKSNDAMDTD